MNFDRINLSRRHLLKAVGAGVVASATAGCSSNEPKAPGGHRRCRWQTRVAVEKLVR